MKINFSGKTYVVTGGASGMGFEVSKALTESGANVFILDINYEAINQAVDELCRNGGKMSALCVDITDLDQIAHALLSITKQTERIDGLVNSAGIGAKALDMETYADTFYRVLEINLKGIFNCCHIIGEQMIKQKHGTIVNIASMSASIVPGKNRPQRGGEYGLIGYCTSKAGVKHLTRAIAVLWAPYGIRANSISPGYVDTPLTAVPHSDPEIRKGMEAKIPLGHIASPVEIVDTVLFLLSDASGYITAQDIIIDGGFTAQ